MNNQKHFKGAAALLVVGTFLFLGIKGCIADSELSEAPKETAADYFASEQFKSIVIAPKADQDQVIKLAFQERLKHPDKEGGIIRFFENTADTGNPYSLWAYVEYHFPAKPERENAQDEHGEAIEVKMP